MFDPVRKTCSDQSPILPAMYFEEKANFAGILIGGIFYGVVIGLCFKCIGLLLTLPRQGVKWLPVPYNTVMFSFLTVMFSLVTVYMAISFNILSVSYVDNREFPGADAAAPPGPLGHQFHTYSEAENVVRTVAYVLSGLLADGLLLRRFWFVYSRNPWIATLPFLAYLTSLAFGIVLIYQTSQPGKSLGNTFADLDLGYLFYIISPSFNILLTLMIVLNIILPRRPMRMLSGRLMGHSEFFDDLIFVLIEPCVLYTVSFLLYAIPWGTGSFVGDIFFPMFVQVQVIAPLLVILALALGCAPSHASSTSEESDIVAIFASAGSTDANEGVAGETGFASVEVTTSEATPP